MESFKESVFVLILFEASCQQSFIGSAEVPESELMLRNANMGTFIAKGAR